MKREVYLICNAHIDPVWLWEWEEGAATALSTFRTAAALCEEYDAFVFNHNEALLYAWIEEYEPALFEKIKDLVKRGKWHIMGGWYLQPDCNMPAGEAVIRQIAAGKKFFTEKFGADVQTAINFDSFGHSRGLVQIMSKLGYKNYLICRPTIHDADLPDEFLWKGYDGSEIYVRRHYELYNSPLGRAREKIEYLMNERSEDPLFILWGVGNHGGGPSRKDLDDIAKMQEEYAEKGINILHSTPDTYFKKIHGLYRDKKVIEHSLNPCNVGCYISQIRVKQKYRKLENELFLTEKMVSAAYLKGLLKDYPHEEIKAAERDMLFVQFHDILPGSSIKNGESAALTTMDHGLEILSRLRAKAFFAMCNDIAYKPNGNYPVLAYNPHPYPVRQTIECEFQLADQNWDDNFTMMEVVKDGKKIPCQIEKESTNLNLDWRKRVVFSADLEPMSVNLFECVPYKVDRREGHFRPEGVYEFKGEGYTASFDFDTGFINKITAGGKVISSKEAFVPTVIEDTEDAWAMRKFQTERLGKVIGAFKLLPEDEGSLFSGVKSRIPSARIIEDGQVRTCVECVYGYGSSKVLMRYYFYKLEKRIDISATVFWLEKDRCLKLAVPVNYEFDFVGQHPFGCESLRRDGGEAVYQCWCGAEGGDKSLYVINEGVYAGSAEGDTMYVSLLRSPAYTGHPINDREILPQDRYTERMDNGQRDFNFSIRLNEAREDIERQAQVFNQKPQVLSFFPSGKKAPSGFMKLDGVQLEALEKTERGFLVRLYNGSDKPAQGTVDIDMLNIHAKVDFGRYEVKTFLIDKGVFKETQVIS